MEITRETMDFDIVIVGAGPAGLAAAIKLKQLNNVLEICVLEKAASVGDHILSGAVMEPRALDELIPDWREKNPPAHTEVTHDSFTFLTERKSYRLPTPSQMKNHGNYIISLGQFCRFLAEQAENMGVNVFPGFAAASVIYDNEKVCGIITDDKGLNKKGEPKDTFQPGMELRAKQTIFAEGCRGSLTETLFKKFDLRKNSDPQTYGLGIKELWEIPEEQHQKGHVSHTIGWPLDKKTYGGSWLYHFDKNLVSIGFVVGLDYENPYLSPFEEFQRFKTHPHIASVLKNAKRIAYGARTLVEGGVQSLPKLTFPGGLIIGDAAGFLNVPKIKGIHNAMKSGMVAAESIINENDFTDSVKNSWLWEDIYKVRNIRPSFRFGLWPAIIYSAIDTYVFRGHTPWTFHHKHADHETLKKATQSKRIEYPKPDNVLTFNRLDSVFLTQTHHDENEPCHLKIKDADIPVSVNLNQYAGPETRYCPASVYEYPKDTDDHPYLQINAANCIHCKACDIKDPTQNIVWKTPEGGDGPQYNSM